KEKKGMIILLPLERKSLISSSKFPKIAPTRIGIKTDKKSVNPNTPPTNPIIPKTDKATIDRKGPSFNAKIGYAAKSSSEPNSPDIAKYIPPEEFDIAAIIAMGASPRNNPDSPINIKAISV